MEPVPAPYPGRTGLYPCETEDGYLTDDETDAYKWVQRWEQEHPNGALLGPMVVTQHDGPYVRFAAYARRCDDAECAIHAALKTV